MIGLIQRVTSASVDIDRTTVAKIDNGLLVFIGVQKEDDRASADRLLQKILKYRVFQDENGQMNLDLQQVKGGLLLVSQFTLAADTRKGRRPSFSSAAVPHDAKVLYEYIVEQANIAHPIVNSGVFAADMKVKLVNDGPVTFYLES